MRCVCFLDCDVLAFELGNTELCKAPVVVEVFSLCGGRKKMRTNCRLVRTIKLDIPDEGRKGRVCVPHLSMAQRRSRKGCTRLLGQS